MMWYQGEIEAAARRSGFAPELVQALVQVESSGRTDAFRYESGFWRRYLRDTAEWGGQNPRRVSSSYGLMQIMFPVACERGFTGRPEDLFHPEVGLEWGCRHLEWLRAWVDTFDGVSARKRHRAMLAAYNGGKGGNRPGTTLRNDSYAQKVLVRLGRLRSRAGVHSD